MFPPFFNTASTARALSLPLHFLKRIFSGPHFQKTLPISQKRQVIPPQGKLQRGIR